MRCHLKTFGPCLIVAIVLFEGAAGARGNGESLRGTTRVFAKPAASRARPFLSFPSARDKHLYGGRQVRFLRDIHGNAFQIALEADSGRVRQTWANGHNESAAFTIRSPGGEPVPLHWADAKATVGKGDAPAERYAEYDLVVDASNVDLGHFLLDSVRREREVQDRGQHLTPFSPSTSLAKEADQLFENTTRLLDTLPPAERRAQLLALNATDTKELAGRIGDRIARRQLADGSTEISISRTTIDGKYHMGEVLTFPPGARVTTDRNVVQVRSSLASLRVRVHTSTNASVLQRPLARDEIYNPKFLGFVRAVGNKTARARWFERNLRASELLFTDDKALAGLDNYGTAFARDTVMTALMSEPIWQPAMHELMLSAVLRRSRNGQASHEETLGFQAYRQNAAKYNALLEQARNGSATAARDARDLGGKLFAHIEDYNNMVDTTFLLAVHAGQYLARADVSDEAKRSFLERVDSGGVSHAQMILDNLRIVAEQTSAYASQPKVENLISFQRDPETGKWLSGSWRDSGFGYAGGRYPMDVNAVWAPAALRAGADVVEVMERLAPNALRTAGTLPKAPSLREAAKTWDGALSHFTSSISADEVARRVDAYRAVTPSARTGTAPSGKPIDYYSLALDAEGRPNEVMHSDVGALLFAGPISLERAQRLIEPLMRPYPEGLLAPGLGLRVANDAYSKPAVWEGFRKDDYHAPSVVWGREANLMMLAIGRQILAAYGPDGQLKSPADAAAVRSLNESVERIHRAVEQSGLRDNELWTSRIEGGRQVPTRYRKTSDVQLWNLTSLAVEYMRDQLAAKLDVPAGGALR